MGQNMLYVIRALIEDARKQGRSDLVNHYKTIYGDLERINKDLITETDFTLWLKAQFKSIETAAKKAEECGAEYNPDHDYLNILAYLEYKYASKQLTESEIRSYFAELVKLNPGINKGLLMKALKEEYPGRYDGKVAAQIAGEFNSNARFN